MAITRSMYSPVMIVHCADKELTPLELKLYFHLNATQRANVDYGVPFMNSSEIDEATTGLIDKGYIDKSYFTLDLYPKDVALHKKNNPQQAHQSANQHLVESNEDKDPLPERTKNQGFVYLVDAVGTTWYKIGQSISPSKRLHSISCKAPYDCRFIHVFEVEDMTGTEQFWHKHFDDKRVNGEWFELTQEDVNLFGSATKRTVIETIEFVKGQ